jgi:hydrogenase expression/formation protein HypD
VDAQLLSKFRDAGLARELLDTVQVLAGRLANAGRQLRLMEVCGTHTMAIAKSGLASILPPNIQLISGPGCPVCVTANHDIDRAVALTRLKDGEKVTVVSFGDMLRVPGSSSSLARQRAEGAGVEVVYSPLDALKMAAEDPSTHFVFVAVGFETTAPLTAATIQRAASLELTNFSVLAIHKRVPPALEVLATDADVRLDGLLLPGHVGTILGLAPFDFLAQRFNIPAVVCGFEPVDILLAITMLLLQLIDGHAKVESAYNRAVHVNGNPQARAALDAVFTRCDATWRGLGQIVDSGLQLRSNYRRFDTGERFSLETLTEPELQTQGCCCGEVLRGVLTPDGCSLYGQVCTPDNPVGPCMVSSEGSCAAAFRYQTGVW